MQLVRSLMRCFNNLMYFLAIITTISLPIFLVAISAANGQTVQPDSDPSPNNPSAFLLPDTFHVNSIRTTRLRDQRRSNILVEFRRVHEDPWDESEEKEYGRRWGSVSSTKVHCEINWKGSSRPKMAHYDKIRHLNQLQTDCISDKLLNHGEASPSSMFKLGIRSFASLRNLTLEVQEARIGAGSKNFTINVKPYHMVTMSEPGSNVMVYQTELQVPQLRESDWRL